MSVFGVTSLNASLFERPYSFLVYSRFCLYLFHTTFHLGYPGLGAKYYKVRYQGASIIIHKVLDWNLWRLLIIHLYISSLWFNESFDFRHMSQYNWRNFSPRALRFMKICFLQVSHLSKYIPRYLASSEFYTIYFLQLNFYTI